MSRRKQQAAEPEPGPGQPEYVEDRPVHPDDNVELADEQELADLRAMIDGGGAPEPEPEAPAVEEADEPAQAEQEEPEAEPAEAAADEPTAEAEPQDDEEANGQVNLAEKLASLERQLEVERLKNEKAAADAEKWRLRSDQQSTKLGHVLEQLRNQPAQPQAADMDEPSYAAPDLREAPQTGLPPELSQELTEMRVERRVLAMKQAEQDFWTDEQTTKFVDRLKKLEGDDGFETFKTDITNGLTDNKEDLLAVVQQGTPAASAKFVRSLMRSAFADARIKHLERMEQKAAQVKADQASRLREKKLAAAPASVGGTSAAPRPKALALEDLTVDQLRDVIDRRAQEP